MVRLGRRRVSTWVGLLASGILFSLQSGAGLAQDTVAVSADEALARSIVDKADKVRFPAEGFQVDIVINTLKSDKDGEMRKYRVLSKGNENTVVQVTEPSAERGQVI